MSSIDVRAVSSAGSGLQRSGVEVEKNSSDKTFESTEVKPEVAGSEAQQSKSQELKPISPDEAKKVAEQIQEALSHLKDLKVSFDVNLSDASDNDIKFKIVDTNTGEVVREYPAEVAKSLKKIEGKGLLLSEKA